MGPFRTPFLCRRSDMAHRGELSCSPPESVRASPASVALFSPPIMGYWNHAGEYVSELLSSECEDAYFYDTPRRSRRLAVPSLVDFLRELLCCQEKANSVQPQPGPIESVQDRAGPLEAFPSSGTTPPRARDWPCKPSVAFCRLTNT